MAAGPVIKYDFAAIGAAEKDIARSAGQLRQVQGNVQELMDKLRETWTGQAAGAWQSYQQAWDEIFSDINAVLSALGGAVGQALANAQAAEGANVSMWPSS
jgi:WXG100 family type VII secretion target